MPNFNKALLAAAGLALVATSQTFAAAWQVVESRAGVQTEIDLATALRKDGTVTGWVQQTHSKKTTTQTGAYFAYRSMKEQVRVHCAQQTSTVLMRGYFDDDGSEIASIKGTGETRTVMPDTGEQRVLARLCNPTADIKPARPRMIAPAAAATPVADGRYMDGPAPSALKSGIIRTKAEAPEAPPAAAALVKPVDKAAAKPAEKSEVKAAEKASVKTEPAAATSVEKAVTTGVHSPAVAQAKAIAHTPAKPQESRPILVARAMHARSANAAPAEAGNLRGPAGAAHSHDAHWAYEGENAPYRWGDLKADYATCKTGSRQSPIDIRNPLLSEVEPILFNYEDVPLRVTNNGHTIQVDYAPGSFILHGGVRYELLQFHFHTPAENRINGRVFDMAAHLVHRSAQGRLAVVAVMFTAGREQSMLQAVWAAMPGTRDRTRERIDVAINARQMLPADPAYFSYMGSLTTPPCTEGVQWLVLKTPAEISREQIAHFTALYPMNARPLQAQNDRVIKTGR